MFKDELVTIFIDHPDYEIYDDRDEPFYSCFMNTRNGIEIIISDFDIYLLFDYYKFDELYIKDGILYTTDHMEVIL